MHRVWYSRSESFSWAGRSVSSPMALASSSARDGLTYFLPLFQSLIRVDTRTRNRDLLRQMVITRDNVTTMVDAVVYFRVIDPEKAALAVENYEAAVKDRAKVALRDVVGETRLDELLAASAAKGAAAAECSSAQPAARSINRQRRDRGIGVMVLRSSQRTH